VAAVAGTFADGAHAGSAIEFEMDDASVARGHGIEREGLARFANALGGHARRELQFFEARGAVIAAIETHGVMLRRFEAKPAMRKILEGEQKFAIAGEKNVLIFAAKPNDDVGLLAGSRPIFASDVPRLAGVGVSPAGRIRLGHRCRIRRTA